jgi:predicted alpha/beta superfamily hydrolase
VPPGGPGDEWPDRDTTGPIGAAVTAVRTHRVPSRALGDVRLVRVLLPASPRDLLILNDGQNVFSRPRTIGSRQKWRADETAPAVAPHLAVVAVDHRGRRGRDYLPYRDPLVSSSERPAADRYVAFLVDELLPWLARTHPELARPRHRGVGGSSYGGIAALWSALRSPGTFDRLLIESPPLWVGEERLLRDAASAVWPPRAWIGVGTAEARTADRSERLVRDARELASIARDHGARVTLRVDPGAMHEERSWAARLPAALTFLFG